MPWCFPLFKRNFYFNSQLKFPISAHFIQLRKMSDHDFVKNPFAALFACADDAAKFRTDYANVDQTAASSQKIVVDICPEKHLSEDMQCSFPDDAMHSSHTDDEMHKMNHILEEIFRFTLSEDPCCSDGGPVSAVFLKEVHAALHYQSFLDINAIERAIFERLLLEDPKQHVVYKRKFEDEDSLEKACERKKVFYLYQSYYRLMKAKGLKSEESEVIKSTIVSQTATALSQPEMFPDDRLFADLIELFLQYQDEMGHPDILTQFLVDFSTAIVDTNDLNLLNILSGAFTYLQEKFMKSSIANRNLFSYLDVLHYFTKSADLTLALVRFSTPRESKNGKAYQNSLLGLPLSMSCLPRSEHEPFEFFQEPSRYGPQEHTITEESLWMPLGSLINSMHRLFYNILCQSQLTKDSLLRWLGDCLHTNAGRAKLWNSQLPEIFGSMHVSDGFLINLEAVLLKLCKPFAEPFSSKLLKVDPTYCIAELCEEAKSSIHLKGLSSETSLVPRDENQRFEGKTYNFTNECFFATQGALRIGFHVVHEKMLKINQELVRIQRIYDDARAQVGDNAEMIQRIKENMEKGMTKFLSYRTALLVPETLDSMLNFHVATATWLANIATNEEPTSFKAISFPLQEIISPKLSCIPEFVLENIADCTIFMKRFCPKSFEMSGMLLDHLMTLILVLMGSPERVKNPHLRAHLAEMLEALMPPQEGESSGLMSSIYREKLFTTHPLINELVATLLHVFVSIEMTGQSVAFEQKFQYRRPMYIVLDYIWEFDLHKAKMKELAEMAEKNIESPHPPIFLQFINLLINDAIFLLDEALSCMTKLRETQIAKDSGSWNTLSPEQVQQQEANFQHLGLLAKFHNVMSNETISTLQWLTTEIKSIFCHPTMVERITAMLNYFLLHLVGPQKKNLKVKDLKEYEFKPQELVRDICHIYCNLGAANEQIAECFCLAVSRDGRSYSPELFPQAQSVLTKIGHGLLATRLEDITQKVNRLAFKQQREEEMLTEAPEEFLDPIMNTIMKDPVKLPSSGVVVDRQTIARHLLSDQTDPFNRSPLTMDMVLPDVETKERIDKWVKERT